MPGGIGDWNSEDARQRTTEYVDAQTDAAFERRLNFGIESTYSGRPGREMVERARREDYRVEGVHIGTESPAINVARIERRMLGVCRFWDFEVAEKATVNYISCLRPWAADFSI